MSLIWDKVSLRARTQEAIGKSGWGGSTPFCPSSLSLPPGPSLQGEWSLQPLPEIVSKLEEPAPRCPASWGQSSGGPTMVSIGGGKG